VQLADVLAHIQVQKAFDAQASTFGLTVLLLPDERFLSRTVSH
jgi:hypothetical protein